MNDQGPKVRPPRLPYLSELEALEHDNWGVVIGDKWTTRYSDPPASLVRQPEVETYN